MGNPETVLWFIYNVFFSIGFILLLPYYLLRMQRRGGYARHFWQRLGRYDERTRRRLAERRWVWVHAVSVGELYVALRLMRALRERRGDSAFVLTVTTSTAYRIAEVEIPEQDVLLYFPVDFPPVIRRVLRTIRPRALVLLECEFWPNLIRLARARGAKIALVNGRLSDRSYKGYRLFRVLMRRLLSCFDVCCMQSERDAERIRELGAPPGRVQVLGSAKYDVASRDTGGADEAEAVLRAAGIAEHDLVLLGGSTWGGEEAVLLDIFAALRHERNHLALVLAPRHAERAVEVIAEIEKHGLVPVRRTDVGRREKPPPTGAPFVLLLDTTGELRNFYACADVIFVGKSLTNRGGQNILEPAIYGKPVIVGPHMENFPVVMHDFLTADAVIQVQDESGLRRVLAELVEDAEKRRSLGSRAASLVERKKGALEASANRIASLLEREAVPDAQRLRSGVLSSEANAHAEVPSG